MRAVVQRVSSASVTVADRTVGAIDHGLLVLVGVEREDGPADVEYIAGKIGDLRVFEDGQHHMNRSVADVGGSVLQDVGAAITVRGSNSTDTRITLNGISVMTLQAGGNLGGQQPDWDDLRAQTEWASGRGAAVHLDGDGFAPGPHTPPFGSEARAILEWAGFAKADVQRLLDGGALTPTP